MDKFPSPGSSGSEQMRTPQEKLQILVTEFENLLKAPYTTMDPKVVEGMRLNKLHAIEELKEEYPELNN